MSLTEHPRTRTARGWLAITTGLALATVLVAPASAASSTATGPSSATAPYVLPVADGVHITSLLTVNDAKSASNGYEMVGIPDGLGMIRQGANLVLYMNQELRDTQGIARRHGQTGAFISRYVIDPETLRVKSGSDWINPGVQYWDYPSGTYVTSGARFADNAVQDLSFGRFCSGTLSDPGVFYNESTGTGYKGQIYFGNEEDGDIGRAFGVTKEGDATALPRLGLFSWENTIPAPNESNTTLVMGQEDGPGNGSQPWVYVGTKQKSGSAVDKAGLTNGDDHVLDAVDQTVTNDAQWRAKYGKGCCGGEARRQRLEPVRRRPERRRPRGRPQPQPDRGRPLGSEQPERLLLPHHRGWPEQRREPDRAAVSRRRRALAAALGRHRGSRCRCDPDASPRRERAAGWRGRHPQARQHDDRHPRQPAHPGRPGQRQPPRPDRRLSDQ